MWITQPFCGKLVKKNLAVIPSGLYIQINRCENERILPELFFVSYDCYIDE